MEKIGAHIMENIRYRVEKRTENITLYFFEEKNKKGESLLVEVSICHAEGKNSLPYLWYKEGWTEKEMNDYFCVHTYVTDTEGNCCGRYNVTTKLSEDGKRRVIDFDWIIEPTQENIEKALKAVYELFISAEGKTATEEKIDDIKRWCKEHRVELVNEMPEGWRKTGYWAYRGAEWIDNGKKIREGKERKVLLSV